MQAVYVLLEREGVIICIKPYVDLAVQYDKMIAAKKQKHRYTAPMLELVEVDTARFVRSSPDTNVEGLLSWLDGRYFEPLRGREDFEELRRKCFK